MAVSPPLLVVALLATLSLLRLLLVKLLKKVLEVQYISFVLATDVVNETADEKYLLTIEHKYGRTRRYSHICSLLKETVFRLHGYTPFTK